MKKGYTRVTEILHHFSEIKHVDALILEKAAARGTRVHSICEGIMKGVGVYEVEPHLQGYINSFLLWWMDGHEVIDIERRFYCDTHKISGKIDMIIKNPDGSLTIADFKTSANPSKTWFLQGSAYSYLADVEGIKVKDVMFIKLSKMGKEPILFKHLPDEKLFFKVFDVYKYFYEKKPEDPKND